MFRKTFTRIIIACTVDYMVENLRKQLKSLFKKIEIYYIIIDESTYAQIAAQWAVLIRGCV